LCELIEFIQGRPNINLGVILENWRVIEFERRRQYLSSEVEVFNVIAVTAEVFLDAIRELIRT
jgi:hypothetical protein